MHGQQLGFQFAEAGDSIRLSDSKPMKPYAILQVVEVKEHNEEYMTLRFDKKVNTILHPGSVADNVSWQADVDFRNSVVRRNRARTLLISTQGDVLIENNNFSTCTAFSLLFEGDATYWYESGPVKNVVIRNNAFKDFGLVNGNCQIFRFTPRVAFDGAPSHYYHKNVVFENNTCEISSRVLVFANSVENLIIKGNTILPSKDYPLSTSEAPVFEFTNSKDVSIVDNKYLWGKEASIKTDKYSNVILKGNKGISTSTIISKKQDSFESTIQESFKTVVAPQQSFTYKKVDGRELKVHGFMPSDNNKKHPCMIYIHGGGWSGGNYKGSLKWARYLSELGCVTFSVEYRLSNEKLGIKPSTCLEDTKSAVRWVRQNAERFNIDTTRIALAGNSAGAHLSAACATIEGFNDPNDDLSITCKPNLLLLHAPVIDNGPDGYGYERVSSFWKEFSPVHNLNKQLPPTCMLLGNNDPLIPFESALKFGEAVKNSGSDIEFYVFEGKGHGLFSRKESELTEPIMKTYYHWHSFLHKQGYVNKPKKLRSDYSIVVSKYKL